MARTKQTARQPSVGNKAPISLKRKIEDLDEIAPSHQKRQKVEKQKVEKQKVEKQKVVQVFVTHVMDEPGVPTRYLIPEDEFEDCRVMVLKIRNDQLDEYDVAEANEMIDQWHTSKYEHAIQNGVFSKQSHLNYKCAKLFTF